nr:MAG TPA: ATP-dependent DNA helicase [Caudoviricetes sp.]
MANLVWGKAQQLSFADDHEYYQALGSLCRRGSYTITFETNSQTESWGDAFRIKCLESDSRTPDAFINAMRNARRINCNDYVQHLYEQHDFDFDVANKVLHGDFEKVKRTVPTRYHHDFEDGYNLRFNRYGKLDTKKNASDLNAGSFSRTEKTKAVVSTPVYNVPKLEKPASIPVKVNVGEKIKHKAFGEGVVKSSNGKYITIIFSKVGEKTFPNPDAFEKGFLSKQ